MLLPDLNVHPLFRVVVLPSASSIICLRAIGESTHWLVEVGNSPLCEVGPREINADLPGITDWHKLRGKVEHGEVLPCIVIEMKALVVEVVLGCSRILLLSVSCHGDPVQVKHVVLCVL